MDSYFLLLKTIFKTNVQFMRFIIVGAIHGFIFMLLEPFVHFLLFLII